MLFECVVVHKMVLFLYSSPSLRHFVFKAKDNFSYNIILLTADVTAPGAGADLLRIIYALNLTDVRLDGFRAHYF